MVRQIAFHLFARKTFSFIGKSLKTRTHSEIMFTLSLVFFRVRPGSNLSDYDVGTQNIKIL